ncbi:extracellular solute-binding protein [Microbacterium sp. cx-55]|uniref:extracellular solute-binding protein n=1 Tax=Microbacterium sp. cx-55 TaxID=2875948 RepID=UPI001CBD7419|nr:extracellular solute-binding protein [Microbacterium sp. cx-55]MBZ4487851.1 extracellular solute-binding protein [Microbacterium sp. cx-55]UGB34738.1 extracellular solute-binding protein [Microbacterium sp. cx-55]
MRHRTLAAVAAIAVSGLALAGCSSAESAPADETGDRTITVAYQKTSAFHQLDDLFQKVKPEFEAANPDVTVDLQPIESEDEYFTKLALMNGSADTAPDVIYEDTFQIRSDAAAGYLLPIDDYVAQWEDWGQFYDAAKEAGLGDDGKTYGVSMGTDTRAIYYNKDLFAAAGLPTDWQPTSWDDILDAARALKASNPDVIPLNIYGSKAAVEQTSMQGVEMLLYGTDSTLYNTDSQKWVTDSTGMKDTFGFYQDLYSEGLGTPLDLALDTTIGSRVSTELIPQGKVAMAIDGSWLPGGWIEGQSAWPEWEQTIGLAKMPTQDGGDPGFTSMSGGWTLAVGAQTDYPKTSFDFIAMALNQENSLKYDTENSQIAVRDDVATSDAYLSYNPTFAFFSDLVQYTHFRPATPDYSQISSALQQAVESVITGDATAEEATSAYDEDLTKIVSESNVEQGD